ncbi:MAG: transcriptional regulator [Candidatus Thermoplasmatota archaeon]|nr:transcriptional regulator [Candidatus Thermoplasmatota archaeon]MCL5989367.1 transcriptional regulator [Candidatus Thermoplasmatota archaeon]
MDKYPSYTRIILELKTSNGLSLNDLSQRIGISKMGILNQIQKLETRGMIERKIIKNKIGRPYFIFNLKDGSKSLLNNSSDAMLEDLLAYISEKGHGDIIESFLKDRYQTIRIEYSKKLYALDQDKKIEALVKLREDENYFPEHNKLNNQTDELLEYNCPIFRISNRFGIACSLETSLFSSVLDMDVKSTHRQVDGSGLCRFLISKRKDL